ncbi:MAG: DUF87 domain-containing protein [Ruminococcus flavefaciens]|nr:DUF87 domain-containing protein [Ruminococcus flavefaciens]
MSKKTELPMEIVFLDNLSRIAYTLDRAYLSCLRKEYKVLSLKEKADEEYYAQRIRLLSVKRCVINKEERVTDCFKNIISLCGGIEHTLAVVFKRTVKETEMLFVLNNPAKDASNEDIKEKIKLLKNSVEGNFPGTLLECPEKTNDIMEKLNFDKMESVSIMSGIPSEKSENFISQGIEKLLNSVVPEKEKDNYTIILLAEPISVPEIRNIQNGYEELAAAITPYAGYQLQSGNSETDTRGEMRSLSHGTSISNSVSKTHSIHIGINGGASSGTPGGLSLGYGYSWGNTETQGINDAEMKGENTARAVGTSENTTYTYKSYTVSNILKKLEATIERIDRSKANGLWRSAAYVLSQEASVTVNVANYLRSIFQGDESYIEPSCVQTWVRKNDSSDNDDFKKLLNYIRCFKHPILQKRTEDDKIAIQPVLNISTTELANIFAFPRKSVTGLPVIECAEFGRNISTYDERKSSSDLCLGKIFHMNHKEKTDVLLRKDSLASHVFIAGTTNAGKSNTIYKILDEAGKQKVKFLVVEPTKGEYKNIFGGNEDTSVYGTNNAKMPLLRINPFSFPKDIHVLEHLDRLTEIFNACWPMYAAMPAVLKNALEKSYEDCGWNLIESKNEFDEELYPNFADVAGNVKLIIDNSEYDSENKGAYKGALLTRLNSLINGINGLIFNSTEIPAKELFDQNVIVDLSRVGSMETKSLIMGMLVLKLQEYRMTTSSGMNAELKHITVLEEAHNLLKHTSTEQPMEGANLLGKSVEMIANAIAEMRTYGEGFIIADQSPELLDRSVIRNTNTKIIMRLPDQSDRELVGKAANLNEAQITELAKLPQGVAAIYQNEWVEPILCKVDKHGGEKIYNYKENNMENGSVSAEERLKVVELLCGGMAMSQEDILKEIDPTLKELKIAGSIRLAICRLLQNPPKEPRMTKLAPIMSALCPDVRKAVKRAYFESREPQEWTDAAEEALQSTFDKVLQDQVRRDVIQAVITDYVYKELGRVDDLELWCRGGIR